MPKTPMDYSNCCIYKIEHIEKDNLVYVGHTTNFNKRKGEHKSCSKNENGKAFNFKLYQMIRDNGGWDNFKMIEVEKYPCKDKREAERREDEIMKELKAKMNTYKSYRTEEERKEWLKQYQKDNKKTIKQYCENNKPKIKQYLEINKERIREKGKEYYENNKNKISEQKKEKTTCECGCKIVKFSLKRHQILKKHIDIMNKKY